MPLATIDVYLKKEMVNIILPSHLDLLGSTVLDMWIWVAIN
jgi:hypothetical protein